MESAVSSVGKVPDIKACQAIVFHDREGRIHHMHHVITLEGARSVDIDTMKQQACEQAKAFGVDLAQVDILHVSEISRPHVMHRVDMRTKQMVEMEVPEPSFRMGVTAETWVCRWIQTIRRWFGGPRAG